MVSSRPPRRRANARRRPGNTGRGGVLSQLTPSGLNFLKCAFAEPDFDSTGVMGVPDRYSGRTLGKLHANSSSITFAAGTDTYILVMPIPGVAYYSASVANGSTLGGTNFVPVTYSDVNSMGFGTGNFPTVISTTNVTSFRSVSLSAEIVPTVNQMTWTGNISSAKFPMKFSEGGVYTGNTMSSERFLISGLNAIQQALLSGYNGKLYTEAYNKGVYTCALNKESDFLFKDIMRIYEDANVVPVFQTDVLNVNFVLPYNSVNNRPFFTGVDDLETIVIRVSIPPGDNDMSAIIKTWHCVEYTPNPGSALYEFSHLSPPHDPVALDEYKRVAAQLPTAVPYFENASFWQRVLGYMLKAGQVVSKVPGVLGGIGTVATTLARGLEAMHIAMV